MRRLSALAASQAAQDLNEFGDIVGSAINSEGDFRAVLWTPNEGPFVMSPPEEMATTEAAALAGRSWQGFVTVLLSGAPCEPIRFLERSRERVPGVNLH